MKKTIWNKRIPTLLSILLIMVSIVITSALVKSGVIFISKASPSQIPQDIKITNISDTSLTITYVTEDNVIGSVNFGRDKNLGQTGLDERESSTNLVAPHKVHSMTLTNLKPSTAYFFSIISGQNTFLNNGGPFEVSTGTTLQTTPSSKLPIAGNVILPDGTKANEAIVYATTDGAQTISTLVKSDGSYILPLNSLRANDLSSYFNFDSNTIINLLVVGTSLKSNVLLSKGQVSIPTITLSKDYDFTVSQEPLASQSAQSAGFPSVIAQPLSKNQNPQILSPKKDEGFSDQQPLFQGTAPANQTVKIIIHSPENIQTNVTTDSSGSWNYRPQQPLSPGNHTITIQTQDASGIIKTITQSFVVYASGSKMTDLISPTPSVVVTATPSASPTITPTPTATLIVATPTPTLTPTPTPLPILSSKAPLPPTGNADIIFIGFIGSTITLLGLFIFISSRKGVIAP